MKRLTKIGIAAVLLLSFLVCSAIGYFFYWQTSPNRLLEDETVIIASGTGVSGIAGALAEQKVIDNPLLFKAMVVIEGEQKALKAGEYLFAAGSTPQEVMQQLSKGEVVVHSITIVEGMKSAQILARINAAELLEGEPIATIEEGSVLPETYHYQRGETRAAVLARMQTALQDAFEPLWETRQENLPFTTKREAIILASIVEKETGVDGERGLVASVFVNRLRKGMKLQSDPTVIHATELRTGKPMERQLFTGDLQRDHPYNTYTRVGLTPGPICNPGIEAIKAVLNPPSSDYFYFVATGNGGHRFARTLSEHNQNVADYRRVLRKSGKR